MTAVGDVLELSYGKALKEADRSGGDVPVVGSGGIVGGHSTGITGTPTIVVGRKGSIGSVTWIDGPAWPIDTAYYVKPKRDGLDPRWTYWMLKSLRMETMNKSAAVPGLNRNDVYRLNVDLPPLPEQRRIAAILDHADALRAKRRQVLTHLGALTQSIFHHMFGDLPENRWEHVLLGDVVPKVDNGKSPNCESRPAEEGEWGVLKLGSVTYGYFQPDENKAYLGDVTVMAASEVRPGDVLMTRKNTRELVGAVALVDEAPTQLLLPDLIFRLHLDTSRLDRHYFQALMMSAQKRPAVRALSSGSASSMPNISKARLAELPLELPSLAMQSEFSRRVGIAGVQHSRVLYASRTDDELFGSLRSRAFSGRL